MLLKPKAIFVEIDGTKFGVRTPYNKRAIEQIKTIDSARWNPTDKIWTFVRRSSTAIKLEKKLNEFFDTSSLLSGIEKILEEENKTVPSDLNNIIKEIAPQAFPFQLDGIRHLLFLQNGCKGNLLGDDMGLGKTLQAIVASRIYSQNNATKTPMLIVCPATLKLNWAREIYSVLSDKKQDLRIGIIANGSDFWIFCNGKKETLKGFFLSDTNKREKIDVVSKCDYVIVNYELLLERETKSNSENKNKISTFELLHTMKFSCIISDESHCLKSNSQRTKQFKKLLKNTGFLMFLTGTAIENRPIELWNLLVMCNHPLKDMNKMKFAQEYCGAYYNGYGWDFKGASNTEKLNKQLQGWYLKRFKEDVLNLPKKISETVYCDINNSNYRKAWAEYIEWAKQQPEKDIVSILNNEQLVKLTILRHAVAREKVPVVTEWAKNVLEENPNNKVIIFTSFSDVLERFVKAFGNLAVKLEGSDSITSRQKAIDAFQNDDKIRVFIGNTKAAGTGITLTKAKYVAFNDLTWVPADHFQAEDRAYRIGTTDTVFVRYFIADGTIDEAMLRTLDYKTNVVKSIENASESNVFNAEHVKELEEIIKKKIAVKNSTMNS